jgi:lysozyme
MRFNLGPDRFRDFRRMLAAIERADWAGAACEMRESEWAQQVGARAVSLSLTMESGRPPADGMVA